MPNAVEVVREAAVGADQLVAEEELAGPGQVGQLELVAGDGVAQVAHAEEAALDDAVEQLFNQLVAAHPFGVVGGLQADLLEGAGDGRPKPLAQAVLGAVDGGDHQADELEPQRLGDP